MRVCVYIYKNRSGLNRVYPGRPGSGSTYRVDRVPGRPTESTGFRRANSPADFCLDPNRSQARVDPPGRSGFQNYG
jgi:hypothetical protein